MADKLPALHFYVQDYLSDTRSLNLDQKGFYVDLLCYMHKSSRRGYYQQPNGNPYSPEQLGSMTGCTADEASRLLRFLIDSEVISATQQGIPYSRRMVRDEKSRSDGKKNGKKGGNPYLKGKVNRGGYPPSEDEKRDLDLGGDARGGKKPTKNHAFEKSPFYPYPNFRKALPEWSEAKCKHYFDSASGYSDAKGGRYLDWRRAVQMWDKKDPFREPKPINQVLNPEDEYLLDSFREPVDG